MQKLTIHTPLPIGTFVRRIAKYNIGQKVFVIEWREEVPIILEATVLYIGVKHPLQNHDFLYMLNRDLSGEEFKQYYEKDIYPTRVKLVKSLRKMMRKNLSILKEMATHPFYLYGEQ